MFFPSIQHYKNKPIFNILFFVIKFDSHFSFDSLNSFYIFMQIYYESIKIEN